MDSPPWPALSVLERRVLGVLIEKSKTTPESYPLSVNAIVVGSNQKSNRDPVMDVEEDEVEDALEKLKQQVLVIQIQGGRVERWRHNLYEKWTPNKFEMAVMAELLLRGPQTEGELRGRASRMEPIESLDHLREVLRQPVERKMVVYLTPPRSRGAMLTHGFHSEVELTRLKSLHSTGMSSEEYEPPPAKHAAVSALPPPVAPNEMAAMRSEINELKERFEKLLKEFVELQKSLGIAPSV